MGCVRERRIGVEKKVSSYRYSPGGKGNLRDSQIKGGKMRKPFDPLNRTRMKNPRVPGERNSREPPGIPREMGKTSKTSP